MQRVLVTGLAGFTGRHLAAELQAHGWEVHGLGQGLAPGLERYQVVNLLDAPAVRAAVERVQPDAVVHLAAIAFVAHGDADALYQVNVLGTRHVLAALAALPRPPRRVLLASSANVYGNGAGGVLDEDAPVCPANDYAVSKLAMEHMARLWSDRLALTVVRPFNYTGRGQSVDFLLAKVVDHVRRRAPVIELGNLDVARDFSDVRAVVQAYRRLLVCDAAVGQTVNVCSGRALALREVLALAQALGGHALQVRVNPALVRAREVLSLCGSPARLQALVGADWGVPPLEHTLRWMLDGGGDVADAAGAVR